MAKKILLTKNKVTLVDDEDYEFLNKWKWYCSVASSGAFYAARKTRYSDGDSKILYMHRLILGLQRNGRQETDHINRDPLDNRRLNLRICTSSQNKMNRTKSILNKSGYKGVCSVPVNKWAAFIMCGDIHLNLGHFEDKKDAARAYNKAATHYFGEFAVLNDV